MKVASDGDGCMRTVASVLKCLAKGRGRVGYGAREILERMAVHGGNVRLAMMDARDWRGGLSDDAYQVAGAVLKHRPMEGVR